MNYNLEDVKLRINEIKKVNRKTITNFYNNIPDNRNIVDFYSEKNSIVFCVNDNFVRRGFFYSSDMIELKELLKKLNSNTILDVITKKEDLDINNLLISSGFKKYAVFKRASNSKILKIDDIYNREKTQICDLDEFGRLANLNDLSLIHSKLYEIFDPYTSHIMTEGELEKMILNKQVIVEVSNNNLLSFLIYKIEGRKFYINHVYNRAERKIIDCIMLKAINDAIYRYGINYLYAWIDETNEKSIKFHDRLGIRFDGLIDIVYLK